MIGLFYYSVPSLHNELKDCLFNIYLLATNVEVKKGENNVNRLQLSITSIETKKSYFSLKNGLYEGALTISIMVKNNDQAVVCIALISIDYWF